ncbi:BA14K family protein [Aminobacter sp. HY435]|uniref:BA14K family protein n=1 Tax=Aminobacter sp. HY435 TaxID=2970917 RepID=UPI0022B9C03C|nr:BA14K family protein [Aminobacter sp. HY435]
MSFKSKMISGLIAAAVVATGLVATVQQSSAGSLTKAEAAALAGAGGFIAGAIIAGGARPAPAPYYDVYYEADPYDANVQRCFARYRSYDPRTDTYVGYDGRLRYCRL